jgi:hypothetical protein
MGQMAERMGFRGGRGSGQGGMYMMFGGPGMPGMGGPGVRSPYAAGGGRSYPARDVEVGCLDTV